MFDEGALFTIKAQNNGANHIAWRNNEKRGLKKPPFSMFKNMP